MKWMFNSSVDIIRTHCADLWKKNKHNKRKNHTSLKYAMLKLLTIADCHRDHYCFVCVRENSETDLIKCLNSMVNM